MQTGLDSKALHAGSVTSFVNFYFFTRLSKCMTLFRPQSECDRRPAPLGRVRCVACTRFGIAAKTTKLGTGVLMKKISSQ